MISNLYFLQIEASRRQTLEVLPPILTLHLKCFVYDKSGGCQKIVKRIGFGTELCINKGIVLNNIHLLISLYCPVL